MKAAQQGSVHRSQLLPAPHQGLHFHYLFQNGIGNGLICHQFLDAQAAPFFLIAFAAPGHV